VNVIANIELLIADFLIAPVASLVEIGFGTIWDWVCLGLG